MAASIDFYTGDDLEAILLAIDEDFFEVDDIARTEINDVMDSSINNQPDNSFLCEKCTKKYKTKQGLSRHLKTKHCDIVESPKVILNVSEFQKIVVNSVAKLSKDNCYSEKTLGELKSFQVTDEDVVVCFDMVKEIIQNYKGDGENFYPDFYNCVTGDEKAFPKLSRRTSVIVGLEIANHTLAFLSSGQVTTNNDTIDFNTESQLTKKEKNIVSYLSGYVFGTLYRRIRCSKYHQSVLSTESLNILTAGKSNNDDEQIENDILIDAKNRGGLWKVTPLVFNIFLSIELHFRSITNSLISSNRNIDSKHMVSDLLKDCSIIANYATLCDLSLIPVSKEISKNLLENVIMLYLRVRIFSFVKDKRESFKLQAKKRKVKSLRTEIKKATKSLENGH